MRCIAFAAIVSMTFLAAVDVTVGQGADSVDAVYIAHAHRLREQARVMFDPLLVLLQDTEGGGDDLASLWGSLASVQKVNYEVALGIAGQMSKETWDSLKGSFGDSGGQPFKSLGDWHAAHVPLFDAVLEIGGPRLAQIKGDMNAVVKDLESMIDGAPEYRDKYYAWLMTIETQLFVYKANIDLARSLYEISEAEKLLSQARKSCTSFQAVLRKRQALVEQWLLSVNPEELDEEITDVFGYVGNEALTQKLPPEELPRVLGLMIEELEKTMKRYEDLYEETDEAWDPFLSGTFYDDIRNFKGRSPSQFLEPVKALEKLAQKRKLEIIKTSKISTEIQAAWDYAGKMRKKYLGEEPVITKQYDALKKLAVDCPPEIAKQILEMAKEIQPSKEKMVLENIAGLLQGGGGETFKGLLADATGAVGDPSARSRLKGRFDKLLSAQKQEVSSLQRELRDLRYQARVLLEKAQGMVSKRR